MLAGIDDLQRWWAEFRAAPLRARGRAELEDAFGRAWAEASASALAPGQRAEAMGRQLHATLGLEHLQIWARRQPHPLLLTALAEDRTPPVAAPAPEPAPAPDPDRLTPDQSRRLLAELLPLVAVHPDQLYRLNSGVHEAVLDELYQRIEHELPAEHRLEAEVWIAWGLRDDRRALDRAARATGGLAAAGRVDLLLLLLEMLDGEPRRDAARALQTVSPFADGQPPEIGIDGIFDFLIALARAAQTPARPPLIALLRANLERVPADRRPAARIKLAALLPDVEREQTATDELARADASWLDRGAAAALRGPERAEVALAPAIDRALALEDRDQRWTALLELTRSLPDALEQRLIDDAYRRSIAAPGRDPDDEIVAVPRSCMSAAMLGELVRRELGALHDPYTAWRLGGIAKYLPDHDQGAVLDLVVEELDRIALAPVDPGNDCGPFCDVAAWLTEAQVERALAIAERMATAPWWSGAIDYTHAYLIYRLADLGHADRAERYLDRIAEPYQAGFAWGAIAAARLRAGRSLAAPPSSDEHRHGIVDGLTRVLDRPEAAPDDDAIAACLALVDGVARDHLRACLLLGLIETWCPRGRIGDWMAAVRRVAAPAARCEQLAALAARVRTTDPDQAAAIARAAVVLAAELDVAGQGEVFLELLELRGLVAPDTMVPLWTSWLSRFQHPGAGSYLLHALNGGFRGDQLAPMIAWLGGGDDALVAAGRAVDAIAALFAD